jgi:hypothetical protein
MNSYVKMLRGDRSASEIKAYIQDTFGEQSPADLTGDQQRSLIGYLASGSEDTTETWESFINKTHLSTGYSTDDIHSWVFSRFSAGTAHALQDLDPDALRIACEMSNDVIKTDIETFKSESAIVQE